MRTIKLACFVAALMISAVAFAQNSEEAKKTINSIKKNSQYIYAEATAATQQDAKDLAEEILYEEINSYVASKKKMRINPKIVINNRKELVSSLALPRGNMFRSFIYVKKSNIQSADNTEVMTNANPMTPEQDEAATKAAKGKKQEEKAENLESTAEVIYPAVVMDIAACTEYSDMANKIKQYQQEGKIGSYARYAQLSKPEINYLAIYNKAGKVVAVLTPGDSRINVKTQKADKISNYSGCGAIGFTVK